MGVLIGCSDEAPVISIGVSVPETTTPVYTLMKQAMLEHEKEYGVKITWNGVLDKGPTHDAVLTERQGVQRMLESKIQALIIKPVDAKSRVPNSERSASLGCACNLLGPDACQYASPWARNSQ